MALWPRRGSSWQSDDLLCKCSTRPAWHPHAGAGARERTRQRTTGRNIFAGTLQAPPHRFYCGPYSFRTHSERAASGGGSLNDRSAETVAHILPPNSILLMPDGLVRGHRRLPALALPPRRADPVAKSDVDLCKEPCAPTRAIVPYTRRKSASNLRDRNRNKRAQGPPPCGLVEGWGGLRCKEVKDRPQPLGPPTYQLGRRD